jgi:hypothetical protein
MQEIWKDIVGYEGKYQISNLGRVKSLSYKNTGKEKILNFFITNNYVYVTLSKKCKQTNYTVHRLVAEAFIENPLNKPVINHIDCNPSNNCVDNLEWATQKENIQHSIRLGRYTSNKPVIAINIKTGEQTYFKSQSEAAKQLNLNNSHINQCCKGKRKKTGGYTFKYVDNK